LCIYSCVWCGRKHLPPTPQWNLSAQTCGWWPCLEARPAREAASLQWTIEPLHPEPARSCPPRIRAVAGQPPGTSSDHNSRYPTRDTVQYIQLQYTQLLHIYTGIQYRQLVHIYSVIVKTAGPHAHREIVTQLVHNNPDLEKWCRSGSKLSLLYKLTFNKNRFHSCLQFTTGRQHLAAL
jgi:hypothetical protein